MLQEFSKSNLLTFTGHFLNASLPNFLHSGKIDLSPRYEEGGGTTKQMDAYDLGKGSINYRMNGLVH